MSDLINERKEIDKIFEDNFKFKLQENKIEDIIKEVSGKALYKLVKEAEETLPQKPAIVKGTEEKLPDLDAKEKSLLKPAKTIGGKELDKRDETEPKQVDSPLKVEKKLPFAKKEEEEDEQEEEQDESKLKKEGYEEEAATDIEGPAAEEPVEAPVEEPVEEPVGDADADEEKTVEELIADIEEDLAVLKAKVAPEEAPVEEPAGEELGGEETGEEAGETEELVEKKEEEEEEQDEAKKKLKTEAATCKDEEKIGFKKLKAKLAQNPKVYSPGGVAAKIGREKYGKAKFQKAAATGKKLAKESAGKIERADNSTPLQGL